MRHPVSTKCLDYLSRRTIEDPAPPVAMDVNKHHGRWAMTIAPGTGMTHDLENNDY